jgi:hypothetical protein
MIDIKLVLGPKLLLCNQYMSNSITMILLIIHAEGVMYHQKSLVYYILIQTRNINLYLIEIMLGS